MATLYLISFVCASLRPVLAAIWSSPNGFWKAFDEVDPVCERFHRITRALKRPDPRSRHVAGMHRDVSTKRFAASVVVCAFLPTVDQQQEEEQRELASSR